MKRAKSDTEISKRETKETQTEINRETKETQTEIKGETNEELTEIQRPLGQYQSYKVTDKSYNMNLSVESVNTIPFTFWRKGKLTIAIKEDDTSSYDILTTIPLRSSTCNVKKSWTFRKKRKEKNLDLRLQYKDNKGHVHHAIQQVSIRKDTTTVTFDMITEYHTDQDCQVHKWSLVLLDFTGNIKQVRSIQLLTDPQNSKVYLVTKKQLLLVEVLEVAETRGELDILKKKWKTTDRAKRIAKYKDDYMYLPGNLQFVGRYNTVPAWALVLFNTNGNTKIVESYRLSCNAKRNTQVEYNISGCLFVVEVLELAETEEEINILEKKWHTTDRAKAILSFKSTLSHEADFLELFPMERTKFECGQSDKIQFTIIIKEEDHEVIYQHSPYLCDAEFNFVEQRRQKISDGLKRLNVNIKEQEVPNIAIIGSGGGMRAVIGMGAALDQLKKENILECAMYVAGLSGSAWYLLTLYAHEEKFEPAAVNSHREKIEPAAVNRHIQKKLKNKLRIYFWTAVKILAFYLKSKAYYHGDYFTFTNFFGEIIGELLLDKNNSCKKWSDVAKKLDQGCNPLPLVSALHVKDEKTMSHYNEWMEFSPYQVFLPRLGAGIEMNRFGDKFYRGFCTHEYKEQPIHFLQGICGSAYAIVRDFRPKEDERYIGEIVNDKNDIKHSGTWSLFNKFDSSFVAKVPNFLHGVSEIESLIDETDIDDAIWMEVCREEQITEFKKRKATIYPTGVRHLCWRKLKDTIWCLFKGFSRVAFTCLTVNYGYKDISRANTEAHDNRMLLVDAGIAFNSPYPPVLHPSRSVDIILSFDFSDRGEDAAMPFEELKKAEEWARAKGVPFPELYPKLHKMEEHWRNGDQKEVYFFSGPGSPTIVHFVMINKSFRLENDSISENFDEILENRWITMEKILDAMITGAVLREDEKVHINDMDTLEDQKQFLLDRINKQRNPALKHLLLLLENVCIQDIFQEINRYVPICLLLQIMVKGLVISADEKDLIEEECSECSQQQALFYLMIERRELALKQLLQTFPKYSLVENFDKILEKIGMQTIIGDLTLADDEINIEEESGYTRRKQALLEILKNRNLKQSLQTQQSEHKALPLVASTDFENRETFVKSFEENLKSIGMQKIVCDFKSSGVILDEEESMIQRLQKHDDKKEALIEKLDKKKKPALEQLVNTLQQQQCGYEALKLLASPDLENKDSVTDIFDDILNHLNLKDVLTHLERFSVISGYEKCRIEKCRSHDDQKHALLKIIIKRRDPALKHLMPKLHTDTFEKVLNDILDNFGMKKTVSALVKSLKKLEDEKHRIEKCPTQDEKSIDLLDGIAGRKDKALKQLFNTLPKNSISKILDEIFEKGNEEKILTDLKTDSWICDYDKFVINECQTQEERKHAILKIIMKWRNPKELLEKIEDKDGAPNNFDILPEYGTMRFSYSEEEFCKFNSLVRHNVKNNRSEIIKCIEQKDFELNTP